MRQDFIYDRDTRRWLRGIDLENEILIFLPEDIEAGLKELSRYVDSGLYYIAACVAYECGVYLQGIIPSKRGDLPLLHYRIYRSYGVFPELPSVADSFPGNELNWQPGMGEEQYGNQFNSVKDYLAKGESYQINLTFPWLAEKENQSCYPLFCEKVSKGEPGYWAWWEDSQYELASFSPELFYAKRGRLIESAPMKGTAPRGRYGEEDKLFSLELAASEKDRAENRMIADMIRNDLGKIAVPGSVRIREAFKVERWGYVHQMISRIEAETNASFSHIWNALYPCASITGAPKKRSMEIIDSLEKHPRSFYTGSIGFVLPEGRSQFNVAIRTIINNKSEEQLYYPVGSGIIWDSQEKKEWEECRMKTGVLGKSEEIPELLEALLFDPATGFFLEQYHYHRLKDSAEYWGIPFYQERWEKALGMAAAAGREQSLKVRLRMNSDGEITSEWEDLSFHAVSGCLRFGIADITLDSCDPLLFHKCTSGMEIRRKALSRENCDDLLFLNERGELCETTRANLVIVFDKKKLTPSLNCGLLPGTYRQSLLDKGEIEEAVLTLDDLHKADKIYLINSVRKWMSAQLV